MDKLAKAMDEYQKQLQKGEIQKAYRGILNFLNELKTHLGNKHPEYFVSALYQGYMDMSYFALASATMRQQGLKIALVYLHTERRFEAWLSGSNKHIQREYIERLRGKNLGALKLSSPEPGVDSIVEVVLAEVPDFGHMEELQIELTAAVEQFISGISAILAE